MKLIGFDIDGVLIKDGKLKLPPLSSENFVLISGRTFSEYDSQIRRLATFYPTYIRGIGVIGDREAAGRFKAQMILLLGVTEFYEDDIVQADLIKGTCPDCIVHLV